MEKMSYSSISSEIESYERNVRFYQEKIDKINEAMNNLNDCMDKQGTGDTNIFSQGENTFKWLKDNLDVYWTDMTGENKKECEKYFGFLVDSSTSPIALVKEEYTNVISAAQEQIGKYEDKIAEYNSKIAELQSQLASIEYQEENIDFSKYGLIEFNYIEAGRQIERLDIVYNETRENIVNAIECINALANLIEDYTCSLDRYSLLNMGIDNYVRVIKNDLEITKNGYIDLIEETETSLEELNNVIDNVVQNNSAEYQSALKNAMTAATLASSEYVRGVRIENGEISFVYYNQYDYPDTPYGSSTIAISGCGPTSVAIVLSTLLDEEIMPYEIGDYLADNGFLVTGGTNREGFANVFDEYGVKYSYLEETSENIISALKAGDMIVYGVGESDFTSGTHFIVLTGLDKNGDVIVADPASYDRTGCSWSSEYLEDKRYGQMYVVKGSDK